MPYTLKPNQLHIKDPESEGFLPQNVVADAATKDQVAAVRLEGGNQVAAVQEKGEETLASIPADYTELSGEVGDLKSALDHTEHGFDMDSSAFTLGYGRSISTVFVIGGVKQSNGELQRITTSRARTGYLYLSGEHRIRNLSNGRISLQLLAVTIGTGYTVPVAYTTDANIDYTFSSGYAYVIQAKDTENESAMSGEALAICNDSIVLASGTFDVGSIYPIEQNSNLFTGLSAGNANPNTGAINTSSDSKHTGYIKTKPGEKFYVTSNHCNVCFYDYSKVFVSGVAISNNTYAAIATRENPYAVVTVPDKAAYVVFATYMGEYAKLVVTRVPGATQYPANYNLSAQFVPERNIVRDKSACLYDANLEKLEMYPTQWLSGSASSFTPGTGLALTSGTVRPYMYTTMEKSKISAVFTMSSAGEIRFGYDSSNSSIGDTTTDSMLVCIVDSAEHTLTIRLWNWSGDFGAILASTTFDFDLTNGHRYCISVEKDAVYHTTATLYDCDCPGEIAKAEYQKTYADTDEIISGYVRSWGCGRFSVISGSVILKRFSMWSTGNAHPKLYIIGDSFVEHAGRNRLCGWPQRLYDATGGDAFLSGRGGARADNILKRLPFELNVCHPQYGIVEIGTNDSVGSSSNIETFKTQIQKIIGILERENIIPVLVTISRRMDSDNLAFIQEANPWIRSLGYLYIDEAVAMSTGDGETQDATKYQPDKTHPTIAGGEAVFKWIEANLPELIY